MLNETNPTASLDAVLQKDNLRAAWAEVKANRGAPGVDGRDIGQTEAHLKEHWESLEAKLRAGEYRPGAVRAVGIPKANGGIRMLGIPNVQDRLIQQAIHRKLRPLWEADFSDHSYAYRPGRSQHDAVHKARGYIAEGKTWVVDIDLKSFFDEVNHDILMRLVGEKVSDKSLLRLIGAYLRSPVVQRDGSRIKRGKGTPQGAPLSPLLANIYLDPLDKELERRGLSFVRYADDVAIFVGSPRAAERIRASIIDWIEKHLKVPVNRDKSRSGPSDDSALLGFRLYADGHLGIAPKAIKSLKKRVRELWEARQSLTTEQLRDQWRQYILQWWEYFRIADRRWAVNDLTSWIRRHMRKCFWLRWHCPRGRLNALRRLGVRGRSLGNAYCSRGAWLMAKHVVVNQALSNKVLQRYGFIIPWVDLAEAP